MRLRQKFKLGIGSGPVLDLERLQREFFDSSKQELQLSIENVKSGVWKEPGKCKKKVALDFRRRFPIQKTKKSRKITTSEKF
jgi:hypothetical protein